MEKQFTDNFEFSKFAVQFMRDQFMDEQKPELHGGRLNKLPIPVSVRVCGRSMTLDQFLNWVPGTILAFDQSIESPLEMYAGCQTVGEGYAVKIGPKIGLQLNRIGNSARIDATPTETC